MLDNQDVVGLLLSNLVKVATAWETDKKKGGRREQIFVLERERERQPNKLLACECCQLMNYFFFWQTRESRV